MSLKRQKRHFKSYAIFLLSFKKKVCVCVCMCVCVCSIKKRDSGIFFFGRVYLQSTANSKNR